MPEIDLDALLVPLDGESPCGPDLEYDAAFLALQEAATGKPEQQWGDTLIAAQEPDWRVVRDKALELARRTRDLRAAVWLTRSAARTRGLPSAVQGLQLVQGLLERHWDHLHPRLDPNDGNDPTARLNALAALVHVDAGLADLRRAALTEARASLTVRDIELAFGPAEPLPTETVPSRDGVLQAVAAAQAGSPELAAQMQAGFAALNAIQAALDSHVGAAVGPDLAPLKELLRRVAEAGSAAGGEAASASALPGSAPGTGAPGSGKVESRQDALRALDRVCEWIERNEPSNPAPLLIRRAQRLMTKNFLDIIRDLVPDGLSQVERLAGPQD